MTRTAASGLHDTRTGQNTQHSLLALLPQSICSRLAGYEDVNDAEHLCLDPAMRTVVGGRAQDQAAASTSEMERFETETLSTRENPNQLMDLSGQWIDQALPKFLRGDFAFALPKLLRLLEQEGFRYAIRIKANAVLERKIAHLLKRPVGRPSRKPKVFYHSLRYRAGSWERARRVVAKVEWRGGELFPRVGFIVTNLKWRSKKVVRFSNRRGTAEQWIKEGKNAVKWTKMSCRRFKDNEARLQLFALAYNLANALRQLALPRSVRSWNLTTLREKLVKIGAKVVRHAKYVVFQLAEVAVPRQLFAQILERIAPCARPRRRVEVGRA